MINEDIITLDETISLIKDKVSISGYKKFEFYFILCLEIARYELFTTQEISNSTAEAITQLFTFQSFEIYYRDYPAIYTKCSDLAYVLKSYNIQLKEHESSAIGVKDQSWIIYFNRRIESLILANTPNNQ